MHYSKATASGGGSLLQELCGQLGLPAYGSDLYPRQKEIAIKGALFPHFIIGFYDLKSGYFVINPHIFDHSDRQLRLVPTQGLTINQASFDEFILDTQYVGFVEQCSGDFSETIFNLDRFSYRESVPTP